MQNGDDERGEHMEMRWWMMKQLFFFFRSSERNVPYDLFE
jgi:hypothetical protein